MAAGVMALDPLLQIRSLKTYFFKKDGVVQAVHGLDLNIHKGQTLALVGESGCGKSATALSIMKLVPSPGRIVSGTIRFRGMNLSSLSEKQMSSIRGKEIGLILQDPAAALNPVMQVGSQIAEVLRTHFPISRKEAKEQTLEWMKKVQLPDVHHLIHAYPHQLSSGLKQRVLIAIALACNPSLLIADEPTTALDVSIQSQILALLKDLKQEFHLSLLLITHDLGVVAEMADRVAVMYAGKIVEEASARELFNRPIHPYTQALIRAIPKIHFSSRKKIHALTPLEGSVPNMMHLPDGCTFHPRCPIGDAGCRTAYPEKVFFRGGRYATCFKTS
jgi:oligopeptide/dipeptide ABC transporter ATP-binding protein